MDQAFSIFKKFRQSLSTPPQLQRCQGLFNHRLPSQLLSGQYSWKIWQVQHLPTVVDSWKAPPCHSLSNWLPCFQAMDSLSLLILDDWACENKSLLRSAGIIKSIGKSSESSLQVLTRACYLPLWYSSPLDAQRPFCQPRPWRTECKRYTSVIHGLVVWIGCQATPPHAIRPDDASRVTTSEFRLLYAFICSMLTEWASSLLYQGSMWLRREYINRMNGACAFYFILFCESSIRIKGWLMERDVGS